MSSWLVGLNPEQSEAALHNFGPLLILAGAGSGKTTVLVARTGRLLEERVVDPSQLCVLTFTNKAARELKHRVTSRLGARAKGIWAGTFHSFGLWVLRKYHTEAKLPHGFGVLDPSDASALVKELLKDFIYADKTAYDGNRILSMISTWRESGQTVATNGDEYAIATEWVLPKYLRKLELLGVVDFDSLILRPIELMDQSPIVQAAMQTAFQQVMVDEFQDTNAMQMRLIRRLTDHHKNISVVGDDDQSIYGWRGACVKNILDFPKLYSQCKVVRLERNYRSTSSILDMANAVISKNKERHAKQLKASHPDIGELPELFVYQDENEEAEYVTGEIAQMLRDNHAKKDIAVLYRSNSQGAMLEAELRKNQIPYAMSGGTAFFDRKEVRDILAYLRCSIRPNEIAFRRIINTPTRGIGEKTIDALADFSTQHKTPFWKAARHWAVAGVEEKAGHSIEQLFQTLGGWVSEILNTAGNPGANLVRLLEQLGYRSYVEKHSPNALVATNRWRLIEIFSRILDRFCETRGRTEQTIKEFVDAMELRDYPESEDDKDKVQLLTLHACKGLEFPNVILMGVEEDLLPHKTLGSDVSEERRLFYVGVTRAMKRLILTRAKKRRKHGKMLDVPPSRFLLEIPKTLYKEYEGCRPLQPSNRKSMLADLFQKLDALDASAAPKPAT